MHNPTTGQIMQTSLSQQSETVSPELNIVSEVSIPQPVYDKRKQRSSADGDSPDTLSPPDKYHATSSSPARQHDQQWNSIAPSTPGPTQVCINNAQLSYTPGR